MQTVSAVATPPPVEPDPEIVTPGVLGLVITLVLFLAVVLLVRSMSRQLREIDIPQQSDDEGRHDANDDMPPGDDEQRRTP